MKRFRLTHSDMPLRERDLPLIPRSLAPHQVNLAEGRFHTVLVVTELLCRIPSIVLFVLVGLLMIALGGWLGTMHTAMLAAVILGDWLVLTILPRLRVSFGPTQSQWLSLVAMRILVALAFAIAGWLSGLPLDALVIAAQIFGSALVVYGFYGEPARLRLSRITLKAPMLGRGAKVKLLHIADVHLERHGTRENQLLEWARRLQQDAIMFTGDFLNLSNVHDGEAQQQSRRLWQELCGIAPVYAVSGSPPVDPHPVVTRIVEGLPIIWLRDEWRQLSVCGNVVRIIGLTCTHDPLTDGTRLRRVLAEAMLGDAAQVAPVHVSPSGVNGSAPLTILLYHAPDLAPQAAALDAIDLHLAGHTHGGQVRMPWYGALITSSIYHKELEMGLYRLNGMLLFVSRGVGLEGKGAPRARFLCPPEIMLLELQGEP